MNNRNVRIDFIKSIAIIFVISIHVLASELIEYSMSTDFIIVAIYRSLVAAAVPLFFMCSGVLLFDKKKIITIKSIMVKYIPRILIALFFWATIYELIQMYYRYKMVGLLEMSNILIAIKNIVAFNHNYQLYYLHIMIVFYLFTPVVKKFIDHSDTSYLRYILLVWLGLGIILPTFAGFKPVSYFSNLTQYIVMHMGYASIGYGLLGYYIYNNFKKPKHYLIVFITGFISSLVLTILLCMKLNAININFWGGMSLTVAMMAYGLFGMVMRSDLKIYHSKVVNQLSKASFAIYLSHDIFLKALNFFNIDLANLPIVIRMPIIVLIVLLASYCLYIVLSKIKVVNKYLI